MKIGIANWQGKISPVFDVSRSLLVVDLEGQVERRRYGVSLHGGYQTNRAEELSELGIDVLICGAVSRGLKSALEEKGVEVKSLVRGMVDAVLIAYSRHNLDQDRFRMPGSPELCRSLHNRGKADGRNE
jgi:predicted Fe-Mo cluster-binding NifX family protein